MHTWPRTRPLRTRSPGREPGDVLRGVVGGATFVLLALATSPAPLSAQGEPNKPVLHGKHWVAVTGKPLGATAGARTFIRGGNAVDAACAMLAATATMWDVLGWGGETQALIHNPKTGEVIGINALGVAPTGATPAFFREREMEYPPRYGPLAAVTPGTPGGLMTMLAEWGTLSLEEVLMPALEMARGYAIEAQAADAMERSRERIEEWTYSRDVYLPHRGSGGREAPYPGEVFRQPDLAATLEKLIEAERRALADGASRKEAIYAAYHRFYRGDVAAEIARATQEEGGLITEEDLAGWEVKVEEPVTTDYRGFDVYKLTTWTQGPVLLQTLNILEGFDLEAMGYNSARYIHTLYQAMNLAFADRDFYYGDPYFPPEEPVEGLLSKAYAAARAEGIDPARADTTVKPGDPYAYQDGSNPYREHLELWPAQFGEGGEEGEDGGTGGATARGGPPAGPWYGDGPVARHGDGPVAARGSGGPLIGGSDGPGAGRAGESALSLARAGTRPLPAALRRRGIGAEDLADFYRGTTSIQAVDEDGWVVSVTPSGAWIPAVIAGETGVGLSQRMQSFVVDQRENPYNVVRPGQRPRVTLTPSLVLKDGEPWVSVAVQGGDTQDQNTLQFLLNMIHFDMNVQEAVEAANVTSYQMYSSFGDHEKNPGLLELNAATPPWVRERLEEMGYDLFFDDRTSGPLNAVWFDREHGTFWGGSSDYGEDYGIAW